MDNASSLHSTTTEVKENVLVVKIIAMTVLFFSSLLVGLLPFKFISNLEDSRSRSGKMSLLICFGGGALLCTTFLHLVPEVSERIEKLEETMDFHIEKMHVAEFLMCLGFFLMYFMEEVVHWFMQQRHKAELNRRGSGEVLDCKNLDKHQNHSHLIIEENEAAFFRGLLVVLALSTHELFEGLAVGLESSASTVWYMFGAVSAHKLVMAFCIGMELVMAKTKTTLALLYVLIFAIVSPLGIFIGIGTTVSDSQATDVAAVILQGLAAGTLLYIVFFEILQKNRGGMKKFVVILLGFSVMLIITVLCK